MNEQRTLHGIRAKSVPKSPRDYEAKAKYVYVIAKHGGVCKVGISAKPKKRLSSLAGATADDLWLFYHIKPDNMRALDVETKVLALLRPWKVRGEWVSLNPSTVRLVIERVIAGDNRVADYLVAHKANSDDYENWQERIKQSKFFSRLRRGQHEEREKREIEADEAHRRWSDSTAALRRDYPEFEGTYFGSRL